MVREQLQQHLVRSHSTALLPCERSVYEDFSSGVPTSVSGIPEIGASSFQEERISYYSWSLISRWRSMHKYNLQLFLNSRNYNSSFVSFLKQVLSLLVNICNLSYCSSNEGGFSNEEFLHQEIRVLWVNNPPLFSLSFYLDCLFPIDVIMEMKTLQYFTLLIGNEVIITPVAFLLLSRSVLGRVSERMWWPNDIATGHCTNFPKSNEAISLLSLSGCRFVEALGRFTFSGGI